MSTATSIRVNGPNRLPEMTSLGGTEWLAVRYDSSSDTPYKFIEGIVFNANGDEYKNITNKPSIATDLPWGCKIYVLTHSSNNTYNSVDGGFDFANSWDNMKPDKR